MKTHPGHISLLPSPPTAPSALQAGFPIPGAFLPPRDVQRAAPWQHPLPGQDEDPFSPLEQPRGRAPRAGARCRSALSRGRAPPRSFCSVSSTSLTELTSRAMLAWLSESSCGRGGHRGRGQVVVRWDFRPLPPAAGRLLRPHAARMLCPLPRFPKRLQAAVPSGRARGGDTKATADPKQPPWVLRILVGSSLSRRNPRPLVRRCCRPAGGHREQPRGSRGWQQEPCPEPATGSAFPRGDPAGRGRRGEGRREQGSGAERLQEVTEGRAASRERDLQHRGSSALPG